MDGIKDNRPSFMLCRTFFFFANTIGFLESNTVSGAAFFLHREQIAFLLAFTFFKKSFFHQHSGGR